MLRRFFPHFRNAFLLIGFLVVLCSTTGCINTVETALKRERWELILEQENRFRRRQALSLGCTNDEIAKHLPDLTLEKVKAHYFDQRHKSFKKVAESFRDDVCLACADDKSSSGHKSIIYTLLGSGMWLVRGRLALVSRFISPLLYSKGRKSEEEYNKFLSCLKNIQ